MIRILIFGLSPGIGGVEELMMNIYRNVDRKKIQFDFVVHGEECYYQEEINSLGGEVFFVTPENKNLLANVKDLAQVLSEAKKTHRIVYLALSNLNYNVPFLFTKLNRFPIVIAHSQASQTSQQKIDIRFFLHRMNRSFVSNTAHYLLACSTRAGEWLFGKNATQNGKVRLVPNGISIDKFSYDEHIRKLVRDEFHLSDDQLVVGFVGRMNVMKNPLFMLEIFHSIQKLEPNAVLLMVGNGEMRELVEDKIAQLGIADKVILTGFRSDVAALFQGVDALLLPSLSEGFPLVLIEAQVSGLKAFTTKHTVTEEVNLTGLVEYISLEESPDEWAVKILTSATDYERKDYSTFLKNAGFDLPDTAESFQNFIMEASDAVR